MDMPDAGEIGWRVRPTAGSLGSETITLQERLQAIYVNKPRVTDLAAD